MEQNIRTLQEENESLKIQIEWLERALEETTAAMDAYKNFSKKRFNQEEVACVEKSISKKPMEKLEVQPIIDNNGAYVGADEHIYYVCPICGEFVGCKEGELDNYCSGCGQKIMKDWSEDGTEET